MSKFANESLPAVSKSSLEKMKDGWKECSHCTSWYPYGYGSYKPAYCRWCGRPLTEAGWEEWMSRMDELFNGV